MGDSDMDLSLHFVSVTCKGRKCDCGRTATHKVGEEIADDDKAGQMRHNFTTYVCCNCFRMIMGDAVFCAEE